jgi:putative glutamine amidotransferase
MPRPVIGVTTQSMPGVPGERSPSWVVGRRYVEVLRQVGAVPWVIPLLPADPDTLREIFTRLDGVFLTGGADVHPGRYGEPPHPRLGPTDPDRDAVEIDLLRFARTEGLPVLAVCRGMQVLNVAWGGTLYQDVAAQVPGALKHDHTPTLQNPSRRDLVHDVTVTPGSRLRRLLGASLVPVNSLHHQAVKDLAPGLTASAFAPDGVVEGVEAAGGFVVGVQWHPEELTDDRPEMRQLFAAFTEAAAGRG